MNNNVKKNIEVLINKKVKNFYFKIVIFFIASNLVLLINIDNLTEETDLKNFKSNKG